jgi:hypothetical protein
MIQVQQFSVSVLSTHRGFFILDKLPKHATEVDVLIQTPTGNEPVDFIDVFALNDGTLFVAWKHPFQKLALHNLTASCEDNEQIINLYPLERIIDIYDKPLVPSENDNNLWAFAFTDSVAVDGGDWRCDRGMYGPRMFIEENVDRVYHDGVSEIIVYEPFLCVNGIGHLLYTEGKDKREFALEKFNNSYYPATGLTLQELLRLIYEWSVLTEEPFNSTGSASLASKGFIDALDFTEEEMSLLSSLPPMQVSNYLTGSETARVRPSNIPALNESIKNIVFKRMACSSLSALLKIHDIQDTYGLLSLEFDELDAGIQRLEDYHAQYPVRTVDKSFYDNQVRFFNNKRAVLEMVQNDTL